MIDLMDATEFKFLAPAQDVLLWESATKQTVFHT